MKFAWSLLLLAWRTAVAMGVLAWWLTAALLGAVGLVSAWSRSRRAQRDGTRCAAGHLLDESAGFITCGACSYTWDASTHSVWFCPSPLCPRPTTSWIQCSHDGCPLSVSNPHIHF